MSLPLLVWRAFRLLMFLAAPAAVIGLALGGLTGAAIAVAVVAAGLLAAAFAVERAIARAFRAHDGGEPAAASARRSLARVMASMGGTARAPAILVIPHPEAQALVARSFGKRGVILISGGLLGALDETELRDLLRACIMRIKRREMVFQSVCAWLAHLNFAIAPRAWMALLYGDQPRSQKLNPLSALSFSVAFSCSRHLIALGRGAEMPVRADSNALRVYQQLSGWSTDRLNPGTSILHLRDPWANRALFPL